MWKESALVHFKLQLIFWYLPYGRDKTHEKSVETVESQLRFKPGTLQVMHY